MSERRDAPARGLPVGLRHRGRGLGGARRRWPVGRVNGWQRLSWAHSLGASSSDGTFLRYGPDTNEPRLRRWLARLEAHPQIVWPA